MDPLQKAHSVCKLDSTPLCPASPESLPGTDSGLMVGNFIIKPDGTKRSIFAKAWIEHDKWHGSRQREHTKIGSPSSSGFSDEDDAIVGMAVAESVETLWAVGEAVAVQGGCDLDRSAGVLDDVEILLQHWLHHTHGSMVRDSECPAFCLVIAASYILYRCAASGGKSGRLFGPSLWGLRWIVFRMISQLVKSIAECRAGTNASTLPSFTSQTRPVRSFTSCHATTNKVAQPLTLYDEHLANFFFVESIGWWVTNFEASDSVATLSALVSYVVEYVATRDISCGHRPPGVDVVLLSWTLSSRALWLVSHADIHNSTVRMKHIFSFLSSDSWGSQHWLVGSCFLRVSMSPSPLRSSNLTVPKSFDAVGASESLIPESIPIPKSFKSWPWSNASTSSLGFLEVLQFQRC